MTKFQNALYTNYRNSRYRALSQVYKNPSYAKAKAYDYCLQDMFEKGGNGGRICSYNTFNFTFAFIYKHNGKNHLRYHTSYNVYDFEIDE